MKINLEIKRGELLSIIKEIGLSYRNAFKTLLENIEPKTFENIIRKAKENEFKKPKKNIVPKFLHKGDKR